jgi:hypothetical protein
MLHPRHNIPRISLLTTPTLQECPALLEFLPDLRIRTQSHRLLNTPSFNPNYHESTLDSLKHDTEGRECLSDNVEVPLAFSAEGMESVPSKAEDSI